MKKAISLILPLVLVCGLAVNAMAAEFQISTDKDVINAGETVTIAVGLDETLTGAFRNVQIQIYYNTDELTYTSHQLGGAYSHYASGDVAKRGYFACSNTDFNPSGFAEIPQGTIVTVVFTANAEMTADHLTTELNVAASVQDIYGETEEKTLPLTIVIGKTHTWDGGVVTTAPAGTVAGEITYTCTVCGETKTEAVPVLDESPSKDTVTEEPTGTEAGETTGISPSGEETVAEETTAPSGNRNEDTVTEESTDIETGETTGASSGVIEPGTEGTTGTSHDRQEDNTGEIPTAGSTVADAAHTPDPDETGDTSMIGLWAMGMVLAAAGILALICGKRFKA